MIQIVYYLKSKQPDKKGKLPVIAQISFNYKSYRKYIGTVKKADWNIKKQRLKVSSISDPKNNENLKFNEFLDNLENHANELFKKVLLEKRNPSESEIETLFFIPDEKDIKKTVAFFEVFNEFIASKV